MRPVIGSLYLKIPVEEHFALLILNFNFVQVPWYRFIYLESEVLILLIILHSKARDCEKAISGPGGVAHDQDRHL
jgi:hypothetical protein